MTQNYAENRIRIALKENPTSSAKARQTVMRWALEDPKLMAELVVPHLSGIVAHAILRVERGETMPEAGPADEEAMSSSFGMELLRHVADDHAAVFGQEDSRLPSKRPPASQGHIDAINLLASRANKSKK